MAPKTLRETVLSAAVDYIAEHGPDGLSFRQVALAAGVSHQAPYHHFTDRSGIFAAIAAEGFVTLAAAFRPVLADDTHPARRCFEAYVRVAMEHPGHFRVMFRADLNGIADHPATESAAESAFNELLKMVDRTIGRPAAAEESFTWATLMWSAAHGFATLLIDGPLERKLPTGVVVDRLITDVVALLTEMVERQAAAMGLAPSVTSNSAT